MKNSVVSLISIILFIGGIYYLWVNYDDIKASVDRTMSQKLGVEKKNKQYDPSKDPSSQEFRDNLARKLYGSKNYEEMKDPDMATRIYNDRMNRKTKEEIEEERKNQNQNKNRNRQKVDTLYSARVKAKTL